MEQPRIAKSIETLVVRQKQPITLNLRHYFTPKSGVAFAMVGDKPHWLELDSQTGVLEGISPTVQRKQDFYFAVEASNSAGKIKQYFIISVVTEEFIESLNRALTELSLRKRYMLPITDIPISHELLEFLYEFLLDADRDGALFAMMEEQAAERDMTFKSDPPSYDEFKSLVKELNPGIEEQMDKDFGEKHFLTQVELSNHDFRNLARQGGQETGSIPIAIWNYLAAADYHNWSHVSNVLDRSSMECAEKIHQAQDALDHLPAPGRQPGSRPGGR